VSSPVARFVPARHYFSSALIAAILAVFSTVWGFRWWPSLIPAVLFVVTSALLLYLASRPSVEIHEHWLRIGSTMIPWNEIRRLDGTSWTNPLLTYLTLVDGQKLALIFPGDADSINSLVRFLRRNARESLIDGVPYRQFWGEILPAPARERRSASTSTAHAAHQPPPSHGPKYRVVSAEEEEEIERMLQRLRTVGHLDSKSLDEN
jgi:hypothetical protein